MKPKLPRAPIMRQTGHAHADKTKTLPRHEKHRFAPGMNVDDHNPTCDIRTSRDGWDAACTCGRT